MTDASQPKVHPSDFLLSPSSIPKQLFCSEYSFNDESHYSPKAQGIASTDHYEREFPDDTDTFNLDAWHHVQRKLNQRDGKSKPWGNSNFITLYESQKLAEDEIVQLSAVGKGDIDDGKSVNKAVRIENQSKPGLKVYQISGARLAECNVSIFKASDAVRGTLPERDPLLQDSILSDFNICDGEYWVWHLVPAYAVKKSISFKSIFAARMAELDEMKDDGVDEDDHAFHDAIEEQEDEIDEPVKLRGGARTMQTSRKPTPPDLRRSTRGVAQPIQKKASKPGKSANETNSDDEEDEDDEEGPSAVAKGKRTYRVAFNLPEPQGHPNVETRHANASRTPNAGQSSKSGPSAASAESAPDAVNYGKGPLPGGLWKLQKVLDYRWAKDKNGKLLKNKADKHYLEYLVKWEGKGKNSEKWSEDQYDSWEPAKNFTRPRVLTEFWESIEEDNPTLPVKVNREG